MATIEDILLDSSADASSFKNNGWGILPGYADYSVFETSMQSSMLRQMNDGTTGYQQPWANFNRFYATDLPREVPSGRHYVFFCRPDLNLIQENMPSSEISLSATVPLPGGGTTRNGVAADSYFNYLAQFYPQIISSLTGEFAGIDSTDSYTTLPPATDSGYGNARLVSDSKVETFSGATVSLTQHVFIPYLTGRVDSLQIPDYTIKQNSFIQPYTKFTIPYATNALDSMTGGTFDVTFRDDRDYSLHKLFYGWIYYISQVQRNIFKPKDKYITYNAIDYATSVYDFVVDETGENIVYWGKYTGAFPTNVPLSNLSFSRTGSTDGAISIPFTYFLYEAMDRDILLDFQYNTLGYIGIKNHFSDSPLYPFPISNTKPIYEADTFLGPTYVGRPVIFQYKDNTTGEYRLKLRWL